MLNDIRVAGATSQILTVFIQNSTLTGTTLGGLTGLVFNSGSLTCYFYRDNAAAAVAVTLVTATAGTFTASGFKEIDATNAPGLYMLCLPDAAFAIGAKEVTVVLKGAANMAQCTLKVRLDTFDLDTVTPTILADALLTRAFASVSPQPITTDRNTLQALRLLRNKWSISGSTMTVTAEDDTATAWTAALTTNSAAQPVTASDPA